MYQPMKWRGFDLSARYAKIERACNLVPVTSADDVPVIAGSPGYFAFAGNHVPEDYFTNPASMVGYQAQGYEAHLAQVNDDFVPYFMPWFGTGVLASAFGCEISIAAGPGNDPAVSGPCLTSIKDVARLKLPDPQHAGWMPRVLDAIDYACAENDLPVGLSDMQGPLGTIGLMCGQAQLYQWMYREPAMIHELFELVTTAFIEWVKVQKQHIGEPLDASNGLQGVWTPKGIGVWESDDDMVLIDARLYEEFVVPCVSRLHQVFGGGQTHFCGNGVHQINNLLNIKGLRAVSNSPMGNFAAFNTLQKTLCGRTSIWIQDSAPIDVEGYYGGLFANVDDFRGILVQPFVLDTMGMDAAGGYEPVEWEPFEIGNRIVRAVRNCVDRRLRGLPTLTTEKASLTQSHSAPVKPAAVPASARPDVTAEQQAALEDVQDHLIDFDSEGLTQAIKAALGTGLEPFTIVTAGLAEAIAEVGRMYETGECFLPELVMAGHTMSEGMKVLKPLLQAGSAGQRKGTVVIGTVQGDLHDIGKSIVKTLLEAAGFVVHDIGIDQPPRAFVQSAVETHADIVALSALLTTTMSNMGRVVDALVEAGLAERVRVMVGGAPISREFADSIGAAGYAADAVKAVREAGRLMQTLPGTSSMKIGHLTQGKESV
jgi:corrinoid protein of di/trimethylamine methyltransferase